MDFLQIANVVGKFEKNISNLNEKLDAVLKKLETQDRKISSLSKKVLQLGTSCRDAFRQTKEVVNHLSERQKELVSNLDEYGGVITESTFSWK